MDHICGLLEHSFFSITLTLGNKYIYYTFTGMCMCMWICYYRSSRNLSVLYCCGLGTLRHTHRSLSKKKKEVPCRNDNGIQLHFIDE